MPEWRLKITFESDWHVGSGAGIPGSIDRTVLRDADGFPYVPGKTLTGILRDSAEFVASACDRSGKNTANPAEEMNWGSILLSLFGEQVGDNEPKNAKIGISDAFFSDEIKENILQYKGLVSSLSVVQPGVKIDRTTGRSEKDHLFTREEIRGGVTLYAKVSAVGCDSLSEDEEMLLRSAVKAARHIGGHRRRGAGKCAMKLILLETPNGKNKNSSFSSTTPGISGNLPIELEFIVETLQPVIVNRATLGNVVQSESFIPGTYLLPYFTKKIADGDNSVGDTLRESVSKGEFSVGPFFPEVEIPETGGRMGYPVPLSYSKFKAESNNQEERFVYNRLVETPPSDKQMKDIRDGFIFPANGHIVYLSSSEPNSLTLYRTHNTVNDAKQHPTENSGGPFTYQAIKPRLKFRGTLRISQSLWENISRKNWERLFIANAQTSIGQSKKDEYGLVKISCVGRAQAPDCESALLDGKYLVVYLLSDVLVRNTETLAFKGAVDDFRVSLTGILGVSLKDVSFEKKNPLGEDRGHCVRMGRRESWHSGWRLPRPSFVYLKAGSVFLFETGNLKEWENFDWKAADKKLSSGVGDRAGEGYGRVLLNPSFLCCPGWSVEKAGTRTTARQSGFTESLSGEGRQAEDKLFKELKTEHLKTLFRKASRRYIETYLDTKQNCDPLDIFRYVHKSDAPTSSQFGILRELASAIWEKGDTSPIVHLANTLSSREQSKQKWNKNWINWLENIAGDKLNLWTIIETRELPPESVEQTYEEEREQTRSIMQAFSEEELDALRIFTLSTFLDNLCGAIFDRRAKEENAR